MTKTEWLLIIIQLIALLVYICIVSSTLTMQHLKRKMQVRAQE